MRERGRGLIMRRQTAEPPSSYLAIWPCGPHGLALHTAFHSNLLLPLQLCDTQYWERQRRRPVVVLYGMYIAQLA